MTCPSCGTHAPPEARFCPSCGHALVTRPDERRVATLVFGDLVGFTALSQSADPEQVKRLVDTCFEAMSSDVVAYGGRVDNIVGDEIVAIFGAPVTHEDDAERAVRCALQMQRTLGTLRERLGIQVEMRVGVNSGEVLVGALRGGGDFTAMGDVVNTASRLQSSAAPGQVIVGPLTEAATRASIRYESLGPIQVKGRDQAVEAWVAVEPVAPPGGSAPTSAHPDRRPRRRARDAPRDPRRRDRPTARPLRDRRRGRRGREEPSGRRGRPRGRECQCSARPAWSLRPVRRGHLVADRRDHPQRVRDRPRGCVERRGARRRSPRRSAT